MVEERLNREFIPALLSKAVEFHCRKKLRRWCFCTFCQGKRRATMEMSSWHFIRAQDTVAVKYRRVPRYPWISKPYENSYDVEVDWRNTIQEGREEYRQIVRQRLADLQQEVL